jgi:hypothetical protein
MTKPLLLLFFLTTTAQAAPPAAPKTEIVVPETAVTPGRLVKLSIKPIGKIENLVSVAYTWVVSPDISEDNKDESDDHTRLSFGSGLTAGMFHITVVASYVFKSSEEISQIQVRTDADVTVAEPPPMPKPPGPDPIRPVPVDPVRPTPVAPVLPDGRFKLAKYMYDLCRNMPPAQCRRLADALSGVAKNAREGSYSTKGQVIAAIKAADIDALGADLESWKPLLDHLAATTNTMKASIVSAQDAGVMCEELATGLYAIGPPAATRGGAR